MCRFLILLICLLVFELRACPAQQRPAAAGSNDPLRRMQTIAIRQRQASWAHWGIQPDRYSAWTQHSNRLVPLYTFGVTLNAFRQQGSAYADPQRLQELYGRVPPGTVNPTALYFDQTDVCRLQQAAVEAGCKNIILIIFDGMDWQTTRAAALYKRQRLYTSGRGTGLSFQDDRRAGTDFGLICTSPWADGLTVDVDAQTVVDGIPDATGGYDPVRGGEAPWLEPSGRDYLLGIDREQPHTVTDSAASATSMCAGIKTYNGAINVSVDGSHVIPIARTLQTQRKFKVGLVTSVPVSHATVAAGYANNVTRKDYQDLARDLLGLPSISHRRDPLPGVDVLIGGGWGEITNEDRLQGDNYLAGNRYLHEEDIERADVEHGGRYVVAQRTAGQSGRQRLMRAARRAADNGQRLLGFYGVAGGHLPFRTADGRYNPTLDLKAAERYSRADVKENPTLADATQAALLALEKADQGFWLMVEAGDVDWANHANNLDNSIGAVLSGESAFDVVINWVDANDAWPHTAVILTADHGHFLVLDDAKPIMQAGSTRIAAPDRSNGGKTSN